jgi:hypothetical protein
MKITIESFDDDSYSVDFNNNHIGIYWNPEVNAWTQTRFSLSLYPKYNINLGDGPIPDWTSLIQYIFELENPVKIVERDGIFDDYTGPDNPNSISDELNEKTMQKARLESEERKYKHYNY